jgi:hypothetical protein
MTSFCSGVERSLEPSLFALLEDVARIYPKVPFVCLAQLNHVIQQAQHVHRDPFISTEYSGHSLHRCLPMRVFKTPCAVKCAEKASTPGA